MVHFLEFSFFLPFVGSSSGDITEDTALALLQTAAAEIEEESEVIHFCVTSFFFS